MDGSLIADLEFVLTRVRHGIVDHVEIAQRLEGILARAKAAATAPAPVRKAS
jgi:hypothetical protein